MSPGIAAAIVAGAARPDGMGRAIVHRLAADGLRVACLDRPETATDLDALAHEVSSRGGRALALTADLTSAAEVDAVLSDATAHLGSIAIAVCSTAAPGQRPAPLLTAGPAEVARVVDAELKAAWSVCRAAARRMVDAGGGGRLVVVTSVAGRIGVPRHGPHSAAGGGVLALTGVLATELAGSGVTANAVCLPMDADGPIADVRAVDVVSFLCSAAAAGVTGETVAVGGTTAAAILTPTAGLR